MTYHKVQQRQANNFIRDKFGWIIAIIIISITFFVVAIVFGKI